jgi:methylmalonyl-CoA/ethylmalonyl-CoA epimerase
MRDLLAGLVLGIDHVGICVKSMDESASLWSGLLGLAVAHRECVEVQQTEAAFVDPPGAPAAATVELVSPMAGNLGLSKFLEKRGDGLHHLAFAVSNIHEARSRLDAAGIPLIDRSPRPGARGHLVAFLHPKALNGTLVELVHRGTGTHGATI